jgi:hypothetical protein
MFNLTQLSLLLFVHVSDVTARKAGIRQSID